MNRALLRGSRLLKDCRLAKITTNEYGENDKRQFCHGLIDLQTEAFTEDCRECKAHVDNSEPIDGSEWL